MSDKCVRTAPTQYATVWERYLGSVTNINTGTQVTTVDTVLGAHREAPLLLLHCFITQLCTDSNRIRTWRTALWSVFTYLAIRSAPNTVKASSIMA